MFGFDNTKTNLSAPAAADPSLPPSGPPPMPSQPMGTALTPPADQGAVMTDQNGDTVPPEPVVVDPPAATVPGNDMPAPAVNAPAADELLQIKQDALQKLSPLVGHLDQTPEDKFKTTMMMIQASDDQTLIPTAYEAANAIESEKLRAQALLDIVNEINYFTQQDHHKS